MDRRLTFVTSSMGTKWTYYSQKLIEKMYPDSKRVVIKHNNNPYDPLKFLDTVCSAETDYTVHIDEDAFLLNPDGLETIIHELDKDEKCVLAGTPDGGTPYRTYNPYACNMFFTVIKNKPIRELLSSNANWRKTAFKESFKDSFSFDNYPFTHRKRFETGFEEPYYCFFWTILEHSYRILYLNACLNSLFSSTDVYFQNQETPVVRHMWFLREWFSSFRPMNQKTNYERYRLLEKEIAEQKIKSSIWRRILLSFSLGSPAILSGIFRKWFHKKTLYFTKTLFRLLYAVKRFPDRKTVGEIA